MRVVLVGGAPGIGKTAAARELLRIAATQDLLVQWVDVDALWFHQPWRVDERTKTMVQSNLRCVLANSMEAGVDIAVVTWVFQTNAMHALVHQLLPAGASMRTIQLVADEETWRERFISDPERPPLDDFYEQRYCEAQQTQADHRVTTDWMSPGEVAAELADLLGLSES